jgi:hypothetical protein
MERFQQIDLETGMFKRGFFAVCTTFVVCGSVLAQNTRSAVSIHGNDANICTVPSPCRTFNKAVSVTNSGGEVIALDSGGFGPFTIDRAVTVRPVPGAYAGLAPSSGAGVSVNAGATDDVILRGITINGLGGDTGIDFTTGRSLHIENCSIDRLNFAGIVNVRAGSLFVSDASVTNSGRGMRIGNGIVSDPKVFVTISKSNFDSCGAGLSIYQNASVTIAGTEVANNGNGLEVFAQVATLTTDVVIEDSTISGNGFGIITQAGAGTATTRASNCTISHNTNGLSNFSPQTSSILSRQNNTLQANVTNGTFDGTFSAN